MKAEERYQFELTKHLLEGWRTFAIQQCEALAKESALLEDYRKALEKIANFAENIEDYYGGVSINYCLAYHDIINLAKKAIKETQNGKSGNTDEKV